MGRRVWTTSRGIAVFEEHGQIIGVLGARAILARGGVIGTSIGDVYMFFASFVPFAYGICILLCSMVLVLHWALPITLSTML